jgi:hypothetical protein
MIKYFNLIPSLNLYLIVSFSISYYIIKLFERKFYLKIKLSSDHLFYFYLIELLACHLVVVLKWWSFVDPFGLDPSRLIFRPLSNLDPSLGLECLDL